MEYSIKSNNIPRTEGIKYAGSKLKMLPYILSTIQSISGITNILDGFSGTTRVSQAFAQLGYNTTANDIALWSEVFATCYLSYKKSSQYYQEIIDYLNSLTGYHGWFSETYGGHEHESKKLFQIHNTMKLDAIRDEIENLHLDTIDKSVILTSLIYALDAVDNTLGHYVSYLSKWSTRSYHTLTLQLPRFFPITTKNHIIRDSIFNTIKEREFELAYFDPPYGSNNEKMPPSRIRYNSYYHIWTTVILHDKPAVFGKAQRREDTKDGVRPSIFEAFKKDTDGQFIAIKAIDELILNTKAEYILLSYSSGGRATKASLLDILTSHGSLQKVIEVNYKKNVMSTMRWTHNWVPTDDNCIEYLFLIKKT